MTSTQRSWSFAITAFVFTAILPIGIHTVMLDDLGVPYPAAFPRQGWAAFPDHALLATGVVAFAALLRRHRIVPATAARVALVFALTAMINQALFREAIMRNVVSTKWTIYPFVDNLPVVLTYLVIAGLGVAVEPFLVSMWRRLGAVLLLAWLAFMVVAPCLEGAFAGVIASNGNREGDQRYKVPYDWHVDVPSYLTYLEPAAAAVIVALFLRRLPIRSAPRFGLTAAIVFLLQGGPLFRPFLNTLYAPGSAATAMLSAGQFTFEAIALALLAALTAAVSPHHPGLLSRRREV